MKMFKIKTYTKFYQKARKFRLCVLSSLLMLALVIHGGLHALNSYTVIILVDHVCVESANTGRYLHSVIETSGTETAGIVFHEGHCIVGGLTSWVCTDARVNQESMQKTNSEGISIEAEPTVVMGYAYSFPYDESGNRAHIHDYGTAEIKLDGWGHNPFFTN